MSQSAHIATLASIIRRPGRLVIAMEHIFDSIQRKVASWRPVSISELMVRVEEAQAPAHLNSILNRLQPLLWRLPEREQAVLREHLLQALSTHALRGKTQALRMEAALWLRMFVQAGLVKQPADVFSVLVAAVITSKDAPLPKNSKTPDIQLSYLNFIFDCFWPFRHPYPAYSWELFPGNAVFYPLAPLLKVYTGQKQDALVRIFSELPTIDEAQISEYLLPVALQWANSPNTEQRRRITTILARLEGSKPQEMLHQLCADSDPQVQLNAKSAEIYVQRA